MAGLALGRSLARAVHARVAWSGLDPIRGQSDGLLGRLLHAVPFAHIAWQVALFAFPLCLLVAFSFWVTRDYRFVPAFSLESYHAVWTKPQYPVAMLNSLRLATLSSVLAVLLSLPLACGIANVASASKRLIIVVLILMPFFSNFVVRMFSWQVLLSNRGAVASFLHAAGFGDVRLNILYTEAASVIGLLSVLIPVACVLTFLSLVRRDPILVSAAKNLGATPAQIFLQIDLPYAGPELVTSLLFCFLIALGDFVATSVLGGNKVFYLSTAIQDRLKIDDWPMAAALGVVVLGISALAIAVLLLLLRAFPPVAARRVERFAR